MTENFNDIFGQLSLQSIMVLRRNLDFNEELHMFVLVLYGLIFYLVYLTGQSFFPLFPSS